MDVSGSEVTLSQRLQILTAEHSSLVAARALAWSEAFSRTTMFLAVLSGSVVAIALVAQASAFGDSFALSPWSFYRWSCSLESLLTFD